MATQKSIRGKANLNCAAYLIDLEFTGIGERKHERLIKARGQHVAVRRVISVLGVIFGSEIMVSILESKLPKSALERWETTLDRDIFPKLIYTNFCTNPRYVQENEKSRNR